MGFIYPNKFTYLSTFVIQLAQRCSDNGGPTVLPTPFQLLQLIWKINIMKLYVLATMNKHLALSVESNAVQNTASP